MFDKPIPLEASIVFVVKDVSPTFLNPDFLLFNKIVPEEWELSMLPITTPTFAQIEYGTGVQVSAKPIATQETGIVTRIVFKQSLNGQPISEATIANLAVLFMVHLDHNSISAIGINSKHFYGTSSRDEANKYMLSQFITNSVWYREENGMEVPEVRLAYNMPFGETHIKIEQVTRQNEKSVQFGITVDTNMHHDVSKGIENDKIANILSNSLETLEKNEKSLSARFKGQQ